MKLSIKNPVEIMSIVAEGLLKKINDGNLNKEEIVFLLQKWIDWREDGRIHDVEITAR